MSSLSTFVIDSNEQFPALQNPPGIEAVIYWYANTKKNLDRTVLERDLIRRFPEYSISEGYFDETSGRRGSNEWSFRLQDDQDHLAQFTSTGGVFSRLYNYEKGDTFQSEAMRFLDAFLELAEPSSVQKLGVRYVSLIRLGIEDDFSTYLITTPPPLSGLTLPVKSFFYQDRYRVPNHSYQVDFVRTSRPQKPSENNGQELIVDINVFTEEAVLDRESLVQQFYEMRWVKSKIFFSCITETALEKFGA
jgi:uncharacterized protein (TIGR04255 family)